MAQEFRPPHSRIASPRTMLQPVDLLLSLVGKVIVGIQGRLEDEHQGGLGQWRCKSTAPPGGLSKSLQSGSSTAVNRDQQSRPDDDVEIDEVASPWRCTHAEERYPPERTSLPELSRRRRIEEISNQGTRDLRYKPWKLGRLAPIEVDPYERHRI